MGVQNKDIEKFIAYLQTIERIEEKDLQKIRRTFKSRRCRRKEILVKFAIKYFLLLKEC